MSNWKITLAAVNQFYNSSASLILSRSKIDEGSDFLIPRELYHNTRGNIEELCKQINKSYDSGIYDGASVLIRKVIEILLILSFKYYGIEAQIKDVDGNYYELSRIVREASQNTTIDLSRNAKEYLELFREKGNLSAHNPFHISTKKDLDQLQPKVRHLFQELLFKTGIKA